jgi:DNA polymerase-3 subunit delta'
VAFTHQDALQYLLGAQKRNRLAHAYLISGSPGSGKRSLVADLVHRVNGAPIPNVFTGRAPDIHLTSPESKSRRITIDQIRSLEHALQMQAANGRRKVAVVSDADRMMPEAANAFLKTLEEPPNNSFLLLLSAIPEVLPETIVSRCIEIPLASPAAITLSPEQDDLIKLLSGLTISETDGIHEAYRITQGVQFLLGQIRQAIQEEHAAALKQEEAHYKNTTDGAWLETREDHYRALTESAYLQQRSRLLETLFLWWGDVLRASTGVAGRALPAAREKTEAVAARLTTSEILRRLRRLEDLRDHFGRNIQETLALEVAFLKIFRFPTG